MAVPSAGNSGLGGLELHAAAVGGRDLLDGLGGFHRDGGLLDDDLAARPQCSQFWNQSRLCRPCRGDVFASTGTGTLQSPRHRANVTEQNVIGGIPTNCSDAMTIQF